MSGFWPSLMAQFGKPDPTDIHWVLMLGGTMLTIFLFMLLVAMLAYGKLWFQAYMSNAPHVSMLSLIGIQPAAGQCARDSAGQNRGRASRRRQRF